MHTTPVILLVTAFLCVLMLRPKAAGHPFWRAMATPLASIIGSGFLVVGPLLAHLMGSYALIAMAALCGAGYLFGSAIRSNIRLFEPLMTGGQLSSTLKWFERGSNYALAVAYVISVTYYLNLFGAFLLKSADVVDPFYSRLAASAVLMLIGTVGLFRGLGGLERMEVVSVSLKLAVIGGLVAGLTVINVGAAGSITDAWPKAHWDGMETFRVGLGLILLVQGFETSRYLGVRYDRDTRIRSMRYAQLLSTVIYVSFIGLALYYLSPGNGELTVGSETAIIDQLMPLSTAVMPLLSLAALASQFSAAVADTGGGGGLMSELSGGSLKANWGYTLLCACALFITWQADIYEIIAYASRAFAAYYMLQAGLATMLTWRAGERTRAGFHAAACLLGAAILLFGLPAETA
ncbi:hypothetical protein [Kordiimonas marina]|uniref:hypothetical protein n=1 Tax=Kordiimonas marina TaxID=2872312 RepID=UPI001FF25A3E|nr:hypothetical protein [Kordiimonas marina]MCJ9430507.1 hypothetical protein [Kordiimonas marina]